LLKVQSKPKAKPSEVLIGSLKTTSFCPVVDLEHVGYPTCFWREADRPEFLVDGRRAAKQTLGLPPPALRAGRAAIPSTGTGFDFRLIALSDEVEEGRRRRYLCFSKCYGAAAKPTVEVQTNITSLPNFFRTAQAASITNHKTAPMLF
jgi:hypothetical protein